MDSFHFFLLFSFDIQLSIDILKLSTHFYTAQMLVMELIFLVKSINCLVDPKHFFIGLRV